MVEDLKKYINQYIRLSSNETGAIEKLFVPCKIKKRELFAQVGKPCNKILFIQKGYFRFYHLDAKGNEITSDFYFAPSFITSYTSFISGNPSFVNVQSMQNIDALEIKKTDLYNLYQCYPNIERLGRLIAEQVAINSEKHLFLLLNQPAEMRYKNLLNEHTQYVKNIPLQYIASYLGISKETLSRMRKTIR